MGIYERKQSFTLAQPFLQLCWSEQMAPLTYLLRLIIQGVWHWLPLGWSLAGPWLLPGCALPGPWLPTDWALEALWLGPTCPLLGTGCLLHFGWALVGHWLPSGWTLAVFWLGTDCPLVGHWLPFATVCCQLDSTVRSSRQLACH